MLERFRTLRKNQSGFTLIELLIVIVILGVLSGIVVFAVGAITDTGKTAACKSDVKAVEVASEAYYAQHQAYAADIAHLLVTSTPKGFLKEAPPAADGITYNATDGSVTSTACP